jgi:hypothetical protein
MRQLCQNVTAALDKKLNVRMKAMYEDITIVDIDEKLTNRKRVGDGVCNIYLRLSRRPSQRWLDLFNSLQLYPRPSMMNAHIEDRHIVVKGTLANFESVYMPELQGDVKHCNEQCRKYNDESRGTLGFLFSLMK